MRKRIAPHNRFIWLRPKTDDAELISWLVGNKCSAWIPVLYGYRSFRVFITITISSSEQLPARSPIPFTVHSTCRAPACTAASEFATAKPQIVVTMNAHHGGIPQRFATTRPISAPYSSGVE